MMNNHVVLYRKMLTKLQPHNILVYPSKYVHIFCSGYINIFFLHDRPWISPWMKSTSNELDIIIHVIASQLPGHQQSIVTSSAERKPNEWGTGSMSEDRRFNVILSSLCRVRNIVMYFLSWRTVSVLTRVFLWCLSPSLLCTSGNKH